MKKYWVFLVLYCLLVVDLLVLNPFNLFIPHKNVNKSALITSANLSQDNLKEKQQKHKKENLTKKTQSIVKPLFLNPLSCCYPENLATEKPFTETHSPQESFKEKEKSFVSQRNKKKQKKESRDFSQRSKKKKDPPEKIPQNQKSNDKKNQSKKEDNKSQIIAPHLQKLGFFSKEKPSYQTKEDEERVKRDAIKKQKLDTSFVAVEFRHIEAKGIGYSRGYSTVEGLFFPNLPLRDWSMFFDLRVHFFNDGKFASNTGVGFRCFSDSDENVWGFNLYYDYRDTRNNFQMHQLGVGGEVIRRRFDCRLNLYFPFNDNKFVSSEFKNFDGGFVLTTDTLESSLKSVFFEGGYWLEKSENYSVYGAVSQYFLYADRCNNTFGGKTRLRVNYKTHLTVEGSISYDSIFSIRAQGLVSLRFPLGGENIKKSKKALFQNVYRNEIIPVAKTCEFESNW